LGIGDWGLGIGDWGLGVGLKRQYLMPNPQSPIPNPQSPIPNLGLKILIFINYFNLNYKIHIKKNRKILI